MVSRLAMEEIRRIEGEGLRLDPDEIVRVNAFGLKCELSADCAEEEVETRVAWLPGGVPLYQPTLASEIWMDEFAGRVAAGAATLVYLGAWACHHARVPGFFTRPEMSDPRAVRRGVHAWRRNLACTYAQICAALDYALFGNDHTALEPSAAGTDRPSPRSRADILRGLIREAAADVPGLSPDVAGEMTFDEALDAIRRAARAAGRAAPPGAEISRARREFFEVVECCRALAKRRKEGADVVRN